MYPQKVIVTGKGIESNTVEVKKETFFTVNHKSAGVAPLEIKVNDAQGNSIPLQIMEKADGVKDVFYTATSTRPLTVEVNYGGVAVPESPFRVYVNTPLDAKKVQVFGPWVDNPDVKANQPTHFIIDAK